MTIQGRGLPDSVTFSRTRRVTCRSKRANTIGDDRKFDELIDQTKGPRDKRWTRSFPTRVSNACTAIEPVEWRPATTRREKNILLTSVANFPFDAILTTMCRSMFRLPAARATLGRWPNESCGCAQHWSWFNLESEAPRLEHVSPLPFHRNKSRAPTSFVTTFHAVVPKYCADVTGTKLLFVLHVLHTTRSTSLQAARRHPGWSELRRAPPLSTTADTSSSFHSLSLYNYNTVTLSLPYLAVFIVLSHSNAFTRPTTISSSLSFRIISPRLSPRDTRDIPYTVIARNRSNVYDTLNFGVSLVLKQLKLDHSIVFVFFFFTSAVNVYNNVFL